ncbi:hypothetical protein ACFXDJ_34915 [Streptomyces sp. NPDC059443]|uniref:hypothetical protein n=1 Tax=unclassified Streptomyces TaxID=2593676 RepID=UPI0036CF51FF
MLRTRLAQAAAVTGLASSSSSSFLAPAVVVVHAASLGAAPTAGTQTRGWS